MSKLFVANFIYLLFLIPLSVSATEGKLHFRFIGESPVASTAKLGKIAIGGLSGLTYDAKRNRLLAITDHSKKENPFFTEFSFELTSNSFKVEPKKIVFLKNAKKKALKRSEMDFESISLADNGSILINSEGRHNSRPRVLPKIYQFDLQGNFQNSYDLPQKFQPNLMGSLKKGTRSNLGPEAGCLSPNGDYFFVAMEGPLKQDDLRSDKKKKRKLRLIRYKRSKAELTVDSEYAYKLSKIHGKAKKLSPRRNGISDCLSLDKNRLLIMERSFVMSEGARIRLYLVDLREAKSAAKIFSLKKSKLKALPKKLVLSLSKDLKKHEQITVTNIEGISWGPKLKNGRRSILFVADNNFLSILPSQFLAYEFWQN